MTTLAILGGSTPFTAALVEALRDRRPPLAPRELVLHGRDRGALELVGRYARARLGRMGWGIRTTTVLEAALEGAAVVVHQIRYGGMRQRAADEHLAESHGLPADETLGPGGLRRALLIAPCLRVLGAKLRRCCPDAWVLNLTNPVGIATALLARGGVRRCVGLCELPCTTLLGACRILGLPADRVNWSYTGLNHRGFIHALSCDGRDYLAELPGVLGERRIGGIGAEEIAELGAIPLKYFRLIRGGGPGGGGRASYLEALRRRIAEELRDAPEVPPPGLKGRDFSWYPLAVVPMLAALDAGDGRIEVVNVSAGGTVAAEIKARVFGERLEIEPAPRPGAAVRRWLDVFHAHERAVLEAALRPTRETIGAALAADLLVPPDKVRPLAASLEKLDSSCLEEG
jgi:6-phospho-beta-glucosidase